MQAVRLMIQPGTTSRNNCPLSLPVTGETGGMYWLSTGGLRLPVQSVGNELWCLFPELPAGETVTATLEKSEGEHPHRVSVEESEDRIVIYTDGKLFTAYIKAGNPARPCFYPLRGPSGVSVTRHWPMRHDVPGETNDHVHHRSMWIAFGDVNGVDNWSEEPGHGYTLHRQTLTTYSGYVCGGFETLSDWTDCHGKKLLEQHLKVRVFPLPDDEHLVDVEVTLTATEGDVRFGDTKEGGILSVRVASSMDVPRGGRIENSEGGVNEPQTWGKRAHWCDYSGQVEGIPVGIAIMQHPSSFRHPAWWHVRDYGLMTVNPFGLAAFTQGQEHGDYTLPHGESLRWRFRVCIHRGNATEGKVAQRWNDFVNPPVVEVAD
jgi:hypothetical protein